MQIVQANTSCFDRYFFGILVAVELFMSFTSLGYIHIPPISITTAYIPIVIAGCLLGPAQAFIMGGIFGIASMYKASASYVMSGDAVFSPLLSGFPISSILLSVGARALFGFFIGIAFVCASKGKYFRLWAGIIAALAPKFHSLITYTTMGILFPESGYDYSSAFKFGVGDAALSIICIIIVVSALKIYSSKPMQHIKSAIDLSAESPYLSKNITLYFFIFEILMLCFALFATLYFSQREAYMLNQHGITVSSNISSDMLGLQIQFTIALLSLNIISVILLILIYKYMAYKEYCGEMDGLTGIMGRKMFLYHCENSQKEHAIEAQDTGWFLFVDADYFKSINDTFGHATGDTVLKRIAADLRNIVGKDGKVGRIGGDEFAAIIEKPMSRQELENRLQTFFAAISDILPGHKTSCSIGAYQFVFPQSVKHLLTETDNMLYKAKENGRACYAIHARAKETDGMRPRTE